MRTATDRMRTALETIGWSQRQLAERLGVSEPTIRRQCSGRYEPDPRVLAWLEQLAKAHRDAPVPDGWT